MRKPRHPERCGHGIACEELGRRARVNLEGEGRCGESGPSESERETRFQTQAQEGLKAGKRCCRTRGGGRVLLTPALLGLAVFLSLSSVLPTSVLGAERTRILFIGGAELPSGSPGGPFWHLLHDPFFEVTPVRAMWVAAGYGYSEEVIYKAVRVYMPRDYQQLLEDYDVISLCYATRQYFGTQYVRWISDAVTNAGKGLVFTGHGQLWAYDWMTTTVGDALPVDMLRSEYTNEPTRIRIVKDDHPLISSLPWSSIGEHGVLAGHSFVSAKEGAEVLADLVTPLGSSYPFLVWWDVGKGRSIAEMGVFAVENNPFIDWEFFSDFSCDLHLYADRRELPADPQIVHRIRRGLENYHTRSVMLVGTIEFISRIGGNPGQVERIMSEANAQLRDIEGLYLAYDFEGSLELVGGIVADLARAENLAMSLRDRTFFWIYLIEWAVLTSTSLVTGLMLWALMVKRRLYTEVKTTRLGRMGAALLLPPG